MSSVFSVDKEPYFHGSVALTTGDKWSIPSGQLGSKDEGFATHLLLTVDGTGAQVRYRFDPDSHDAGNGHLLYAASQIELKSLAAIRNLRLYCVASANIRYSLMR